jgi:glycosyltransferase involved in cell wall biosynthesis
MSTRPLVSVLMPTFEGAAFVSESIESALAQSYRPLELIVIDDASGDETPEIVRRYASVHPSCIHFERRDERAGPCRRRNDALALSTGEILAWLDQDDVWLPGKLERQVEILLERPQVGLVYTDHEEFDSGTGLALPLEWPHVAVRGDILADLFVEDVFICSSSAVWRREAMSRRRLRFRDKDFSFGDDHFLWLAIALDWRVERIDDVLVRYRRHECNESRRRAEVNFHLARVALLKEFLTAYPEAAERLGRVRRTGFARHFVRAAKFEAVQHRPCGAARCAVRAIRWHPGVVAERVANEICRGASVLRRRLARSRTPSGFA